MGALDRYGIAHGQYWRLATAPLLHASVGHLFANCVALLLAGYLLEPIIGAIRRAAIFIFCALCGGLASVWFNPASVVSVGASGGIMGFPLRGAFIAKISGNLHARPARRTPVRLSTTCSNPRLFGGLILGSDVVTLRRFLRVTIRSVWLRAEEHEHLRLRSYLGEGNGHPRVVLVLGRIIHGHSYPAGQPDYYVEGGDDLYKTGRNMNGAIWRMRSRCSDSMTAVPAKR